MIKRRDDREVMTVVSQGQGTVVMRRASGDIEAFDIRPAIQQSIKTGHDYLAQRMGGVIVRTQPV